jgi:hypothetical protein
VLQFIAKFIADEEAKNGAFDGVLGYSQGGTQVVGWRQGDTCGCADH